MHPQKVLHRSGFFVREMASLGAADVWWFKRNKSQKRVMKAEVGGARFITQGFCRLFFWKRNFNSCMRQHKSHVKQFHA